MKRKNHNNRQVELPNFCHLGVNLRIALTVEAALVAGVVARVPDVPAFWMEFIAQSALAQPALLLTLLALCAAGRWLRSQPYRLGVGYTLALGVAVPLLTALWLSPLLGGQAAGQAVKLSTCLALALGVHLAGGVEAPALDGAWAVAGLLGREAVFGVAIGLVVGLPFDAARVGGRFIDTFRGTSAEASLPFAGSREAASGDALYQLVGALAISGGGASIAISGALRSFGAVHLGAFVPTEAAALQLAGLAAGALATGLAVGAPIAGCALAVDAALGLAFWIKARIVS